MTDRIDYYFTSVSPFTWMGHQTLVQIAGRHDVPIRYKPFSMPDVWAVSEAVPPAKRSATRQRYRLVELQRVARFRKLDIRTKPEHFPTDPTLADHCVIVIQEAGGDPGPFLFRAGEAVWIKDRQIADASVLREILRESGQDAEAVLQKAESTEIAAIRKANTQDAIEADAIGAPAYVYKGEVFWGQDRLEYLDEMITSGRVAFKPE